MHNSIKNKHKSRSFEKITHIPLFTSLSPQASSSSSILSHSKVQQNTIHTDIDSTDNYLLKRVQSIHVSNLRCCDCGATKTVDWISINLLCILCIKCSGVHRSLGTHISKIRSLTLDTFKDKELRYLIKHDVRNDYVNQIYESQLICSTDKINSDVSDSRRLLFIRDKYIHRKYVKDNGLDFETSLKRLIKGIHNEKIIDLQQIIAQSEKSLRKLSQQYNEQNQNNNKYVSLFKYSLKHNIHKDDGTIIFNITEFLLINDLIIDNNIPIQSSQRDKWPQQALEFWNTKLDIYGDVFLSIDKKVPVVSQPTIDNNKDDDDNTLPVIRSLSIDQKKRKNSMKRWSLANIPKTSQNIISMHKSLKRSTKKNNPNSTTAPV